MLNLSSQSNPDSSVVNSIKTDVGATIEAMTGKRGTRRLSWSRFEDVASCPAAYFLKAFNKSITPAAAIPDDTYSLDGKVIQRVIDLYYRDNVFAAEVERSRQNNEFHILIDEAVRGYANAMILSPKQCSQLGIVNLYAWAESAVASQWVNERADQIALKSKYNLRPFLCSKPSFSVIDLEKFEVARNKSLQDVLANVKQKLNSCLPDLQSKLVRDRTGTEVWVSTDLNGFECCGMADFITNLQIGAPRPVKMWNVRSGYILTDGKNRMNSYQTHDQLQYYAECLKSNQKVVPFSLTLYDYSTATPYPTTFNPDFIHHMNKVTLELLSHVTQLQIHLADVPKDRPIEEPWKLLERRPGQTCQYCPAGDLCDLSTRRTKQI